MAVEVVMVFDFDKTIIDCDSDDWVVEKLGLTELFCSLLPTMPYNALMDRMMEELHLRGTTIQEIVQCLKMVPLSPNLKSAIQSAYSSGCDLRIVSDANTFFIETILENYGILHCFSEINTNPSVISEDGRLKIMPCHDSKSTCHGCNLCPSNLCKGLVIERIQRSSLEKQFIYVGDGKNDFCPSLKLSVRDYVMPRKNYPLWDAIYSDFGLIKARVHEWNSDEEQARIMINLIDSLIVQENREEFIMADCKFQIAAVSASGLFQKAVQVPH